MITRSLLNSNMQRPRHHGWAAFDQKQRERRGTGTKYDGDPCPSIMETTSVDAAKSWIKNNSAPIKSFSSVVRPSVGFPPATSNRENQIMNDSRGTKDHCNQVARESDEAPVKMLKDIHMWADQALIEDVLAAVNNDMDEASVLLEAMVSSESKFGDSSLSDPSSSLDIFCEDRNKCSGEANVVEDKSKDGHDGVLSKCSFSVPVEPEWVEDDAYSSHRKDAIRMMRISSKHSRAANNAFLRGDHISAHKYSLKARDERMVAEKLNASAAEEILRIRNSNNGIWKLDLHGLHATEAVSALKEHLQKIESGTLLNRSISSDALTKLEVGIPCSSSSGCISGMERNSETKRKIELPHQRQMILHVITGIGNHSRGQAALPTAVKSFLIENGYRFDEARPGVLGVRPKFRHN